MKESPLNFFGAIGRAASSLFGRRAKKSRGRGNTLSASQLEGARRAFGGTKRNSFGSIMSAAGARKQNNNNSLGSIMSAAGLKKQNNNTTLADTLPPQTQIPTTANNAASIQQEALASVENSTVNPSTIPQTPISPAAGLNTLAQGPSPVNPTDVIQEDASDIYSGAAFGNQAFTKKGSIIPNLIKTKK